MDDTTQTPEQVVVAFIKAMHDWEVDAYQRYKPRIFGETDHAKILAASSQASEERQQVIAQFCSNTKRYAAPFGDPPQYDPVHEQITELRKQSAKRAEVLTEYVYPQKYIQQKRRYKLIYTPAGWKIDDRTTELNGRWYSSL